MLRSGSVDDYEAWLALRENSRPHLTEWEENWTREEATLSAYRQRLRHYDREMKRGAGLPLFAFRRRDHALVGGVTLTNIRYGAARTALIGYWIGAPYTKCGYGTAAVEAMLCHAFTAIELNRIEAACQPANVASKKLLQRCGFRREGLARDYLRINGAWRDHEIYAMTAADYRERDAIGRSFETK